LEDKIIPEEIKEMYREYGILRPEHVKLFQEKATEESKKRIQDGLAVLDSLMDLHSEVKNDEGV
jgi:hypothetical protein